MKKVILDSESYEASYFVIDDNYKILEHEKIKFRDNNIGILKLINKLSNMQIIGHHIISDIRTLHDKSNSTMSINPNNLLCTDTLQTYIDQSLKLWRMLEVYNIDKDDVVKLCKDLGYDSADYHDSMFDVAATYLVLPKLMEKYNKEKMSRIKHYER